MVIKVILAVFAFLVTSRVMKARMRDYYDRQDRKSSGDRTDQVER